jgi:hypothetical protein
MEDEEGGHTRPNDAPRCGQAWRDGAFEILLTPLLVPGYRLAGGMLQDHQLEA